MGDLEAAGEVPGVVVLDLGADALHALVCLDQQPPRLGHPWFGDPLHHSAVVHSLIAVVTVAATYLREMGSA